MPVLNKLNSLSIKSFGPGKYSDGGGLWLHKRLDGGAQWFLRVTVYGNRREMGAFRVHSGRSRVWDGTLAGLPDVQFGFSAKGFSSADVFCRASLSTRRDLRDIPAMAKNASTRGVML